MTLNNNVVVLFGGTSSERMVATASAQYMAAELGGALFWYWSCDGTVLEVSRDELLAHQNPFKVTFEPRQVAKKWARLVDALDEAKRESHILFLSLHGGEGEDGSLQRQLEERSIAFTGSGAQASRDAFDKERAKFKLKNSDIKLADAICIRTGVATDSVRLAEFQRRHRRLVAKPKCDGSSVGLAFLESSEAVDEWWKKSANEEREFIVEERILGREFTVGVVDLGKGIMPLPVSEVVITNPGGAFDYDGKYLGRGTKEITPADVTEQEQTILQHIGTTAHALLGCAGYSRTDVIMGPGGAYFLETNTLPGLTRASFIPQQLAAAGIPMKAFLAAQIELATRRAWPAPLAL